jgi:cell division protein FtsN
VDGLISQCNQLKLLLEEVRIAVQKANVSGAEQEAQVELERRLKLEEEKRNELKEMQKKVEVAQQSKVAPTHAAPAPDHAAPAPTHTRGDVSGTHAPAGDAAAGQDEPSCEYLIDLFDYSSRKINRGLGECSV